MNKSIALDGGWSVQSWYDNKTRTWVSQLKDHEGNQVGDACFDGTSSGVKSSQKSLVDRFYKDHSLTNMSPDSAKVNACQILEKLRDNFPDTLEKILIDIDLADNEFVKMMEILQTPESVK